MGTEDIKIENDESYSITKPLTIKNGNLKNGTFIVQNTGVKFDNILNVFAVIVGEGVADGEFNLANCYKVDEVYVNGGGKNSVHISNTQVEKLTVNKKGVRIALDEDKKSGGATTIGKAFIMQDCKLDSESQENSFGSVVVSDAVKTLDLAGFAAIDEIISTATQSTGGNVNVTINVTVNVVINGVDNTLSKDNFTAVDDKGNAVEDGSVTLPSDESFKDMSGSDTKNDLIDEIGQEQDKINEAQKPTYTIDLTPYISAGVIEADKWETDYYSFLMDITKAFNGKLPKSGEVIEYTVTGTFGETIPRMAIQFADNSEKVDWWKSLSSCITYDDLGIEAGKEVTFTKKTTFYDDAEENVSMQFVIEKTVLNKSTIFTPSGWAGTIHTVNLDSLMQTGVMNFDHYSKNVDDSYNYTYTMNVTEAFKGKLPKAGDIIVYSMTGTFSQDIPKMTVRFADNSEEANWWTQLFSDDTLDIKANTPVTFSKKMVVAADAIKQVSVQFAYSNKDLNKSTIFTTEDWKGNIYTIDDAAAYIYMNSTVMFRYSAPDQWRDEGIYSYNFNVFKAFKTPPKKGDIVMMNFTGKFDKDLPLLEIAYFDDSEPWHHLMNVGTKAVFADIKANEPFTIDCGYVLTEDLNKDSDRFFFDMVYDIKDTGIKDAVIFYKDKLNIIEPDVSSVLKEKNRLFKFLDRDEQNRKYRLDMDITKAFNGTLPKKGDVVKLKFSAVSDRDIGKLDIEFQDPSKATGYYRNLNDYQNASVVDIKANVPFVFEKTIVMAEDAATSFVLKMSYDLNDPPGATISASEYDPIILDLSKGDILSSRYFVKNLEWKHYNITVDVTKLLNGRLPKKGDIIELTLKGKFDKDAADGTPLANKLWLQMADNSANAGGWLQIVSYYDEFDPITIDGKEFTLKQKFEVENDLVENLVFQFGYNFDALDDYAQFIVNGKEVTQTLYKLDLTDCLKSNAFDHWIWDGGSSYGKNFDITEAFKGKLPKKDDIIDFTFSDGRFTSEVTGLNAWIRSGIYDADNPEAEFELGYIGQIAEKVSADTEFGASGVIVAQRDAKDIVLFQMQYDASCGESAFLDKDATVYEVDLTEYTSSRQFDRWTNENGELESYGCDIDVTEAFKVKNITPKKGDIVNYTIEGTFTTDIDVLSIWLHNQENGNYFANWNKSVDIKANQKSKIVGIGVFEKDGFGTFEICMCYDKKYEHGVFLNKNAKVYDDNIDLTDYVYSMNFHEEGDDHRIYCCDWPGIDVTDAFKTIPVAKGDYVKFTVSGKFTKDIDNIRISFESIGQDEYAWLGSTGIPVAENLKANTEFTANGGIVFLDDPIDGNIYLGFDYDAEGNEEATFISNNAKPYTVDLTKYLDSKEFADWDSEYGYACIVTDAFDTVPKKGDYVEFSFTGRYTTSIDDITVIFESIDCWLAQKTIHKEIVANNNVTISTALAITSDPKDLIALRLQYDESYGPGVFLNKDAKEYNVDLTPCLTTEMFETWEDCYGKVYDITAAFDTPLKKNDYIKFSISGKFDKNVTSLGGWFPAASQQDFILKKNIASGVEFSVERGIVYEDCPALMNFHLSTPLEGDAPTFTPVK